MEVAACAGNIAQIDGDELTPYAHTHAVLAQADGSVVAGHLNAATVFVGEVYMRTFDTDFTREAAETPILETDEAWDERVNEGDRETDPVTGLELWQ
jgi:predicted DNA-binding protein with PD1-like motif